MTQTYYWINTVDPFSLMLIGLIGFIIVMLPTFIAALREHPSSIAICILNLLFGWTGIGWLVLLVWSFSTPSPNNDYRHA